MESTTIPLYDRVKNQVYDDYERLKRQQTMILTARSKRKRVLALKSFRSKYFRLFFEIYHLSNYDLLPKVIKNNLEYFAEDIKRINSMSKVYYVMLFCADVIKELKISKITYERDNDSF